MFDTHCHLNFKSFKKNLPEVISGAQTAGVDGIVIPGTDVPSSKNAIDIASKYEGTYAAVGIHPHHVYELKEELIADSVSLIDKMLTEPKVVAVGEVGMDRHVYEKTKYTDYSRV